MASFGILGGPRPSLLIMMAGRTQGVRLLRLRMRHDVGCDIEESLVADGTFEKNCLSGKLVDRGVCGQCLKSGRSGKAKILAEDWFVVWGGM